MGDDLCYGYSHSGSSRLLWHSERLMGGGNEWGTASCHIKISAYSTAYGYTDEGAGDCVREEDDEKHDVLTLTMTTMFECSNNCASSELCYGFSWRESHQCDLWKEEVKSNESNTEDSSDSRCWKKPFFKPTLSLDFTKKAFENAQGDDKNLPSFATLQKYVLRAG